VALVQGTIHQNGGTSSTTCVGTLGSPVGAGNAVCIVFSGGFAVSDLVGVQDDKGNTYNLTDAIEDFTGGGYAGGAYYLENVTGGPTTFTGTLGTAKSFVTIIIEEFSGIATSSALDGHAALHSSAPGTTDGATSGTFTTTTDGDLIWGCGISLDGQGMSPGTGFTAGSVNNVVNTFTTENQIQTTHSSSSQTTFTPGAVTTALVWAIALKSASTPDDSTGEADGRATAQGDSKTKSLATGTANGLATATGAGKTLTKATGQASGLATATGVGKTLIKVTGQASGLATAQAIGKTLAKTTGQAAGHASAVGTSQEELPVGTANGHATATGQSKTIHYTVGHAAGHASVMGATPPPVNLGYWLSPSIPYPITPPGTEYITSADGNLQPGAVMQSRLKAQRLANETTPKTLGRSRGPTRTQFNRPL
jgi:hypothetical protein